MYLAIDTSSENTGLAIIHDGQIVAENLWQCARNHTVELLPHLEVLLKQAKLEIKDIKGIIVACGPGSFNGLRVGMSCAKGLAYSLNVPIAGIGTLEAAAYQYAASSLPVCAILNAGRGEISCAFYRLTDDRWECLVQENITTLEALLKSIAAKTVFCGELTDAMLEQIHSMLEDNAVIPSGNILSRSASLAILGEKRLKQGISDNIASIHPIYLRPPHISQPKSKGAGARTIENTIQIAVIWDMDGTIADTAEQHLRAWQKVFKKRGIAFSRRDFLKSFGLRNDTVIRGVAGNQVTQEEIASLSLEKNAAFRESLRCDGVRPMKGAIELFEALHKQNIPMAIASSAPGENLDYLIKKLDIERFLEATVSGEEVKRGKPDPLSFLIAAEKLKTQPSRCVVIEDAVGGIQAAISAGMRSIALTGSHSREELEMADLVVDSLPEISMSDIEKLMQR